MGQLQSESHECDFCSVTVVPNTGGWVYPCGNFSDLEKKITYNGAWLACPICAAYVRQYDAGEIRARDNLTSRSIRTYRQKYGLADIPGVKNLYALLAVEIGDLHRRFWDYRMGEPKPYDENYVEG